MGPEEPNIEQLAPNMSRAVEPESPAALAMKRAMDKRKGAAVPPVKARKRSTCRICGGTGHNASTCTQAKPGQTPARKKYVRRASGKAAPAAIVHVPTPDLQKAVVTVSLSGTPATDLLTIITEGHRLMDRIERLFGKQP